MMRVAILPVRLCNTGPETHFPRGVGTVIQAKQTADVWMKVGKGRNINQSIPNLSGDATSEIIEIKKEDWVVVDVPDIRVKNITVYGKLSFDDSGALRWEFERRGNPRALYRHSRIPNFGTERLVKSAFRFGGSRAQLRVRARFSSCHTLAIHAAMNTAMAPCTWKQDSCRKGTTKKHDFHHC